MWEVIYIEIYREFGIYRITNLVNGKTYIGKTGVSFGDRWDCHKAQLNGGYHDNPHLQRAWNKYGQDNFEFCIIESVSDSRLLNELECKYIKQYRQAGICYNIHDGGDGGFMLGKHLSEETKRKIGEKNRINMTGKKANNETRLKMSNSQKNVTSLGRKKTELLMAKKHPSMHLDINGAMSQKRIFPKSNRQSQMELN